MPLALERLPKLLAEGGAVVAGGAAFFAAVAWILAGLLVDLGYTTIDPLRWAERGGQWGGVFGLTTLATSGLHLQ
jgi:hypothetical protein